MARRLALHSFVLVVVLACVAKAHAQEIPEDVAAVAQEAGVDPVDLAGAVNTTGLTPREYLVAVGELAAPTRPSGWPFDGPVAQRIYCIERIESAHGKFMFNATPWYGEHAQGWLGWLPSTARRWGVVIGDRASEWTGAAHMLIAGAGGQFYGIHAGIC